MDSRVRKFRIPRIPRIAIALDEKDREAIAGILVNVVVYASAALVVAIVAGTAIGIFILLVRTIGGI